MVTNGLLIVRFELWACVLDLPVWRVDLVSLLSLPSTVSSPIRPLSPPSPAATEVVGGVDHARGGLWPPKSKKKHQAHLLGQPAGSPSRAAMRHDPRHRVRLHGQPSPSTMPLLHSSFVAPDHVYVIVASFRFLPTPFISLDLLRPSTSRARCRRRTEALNRFSRPHA